MFNSHPTPSVIHHVIHAAIYGYNEDNRVVTTKLEYIFQYPIFGGNELSKVRYKKLKYMLLEYKSLITYPNQCSKQLATRNRLK